ncbi:lysophospholipid acyltransferase family protein [Piscinibacter sakaiensis]|uniref:lysophospholipid acyltransferase family protein n=1 Tax=Piscinibacter sakaiensis TaxID=1547922 RepID=UPI003AAC47FB
MLRTLISGLLLAVLLLGLGLMSLAWNLVAALLHPLLGASRGKAIGRWAISRCYAGFWTVAGLTGVLRLDSSALDAFRDEPRLIFAANHPSMLDALILVARLPRSACIMKAELMRNVFLGAGARLARYIRNDSARGMVRLAVQDLREGGQLVIFPEGTRTTRPPINGFGSAATLISKLADAPIQTVFIETDSPYLGKGWPIWRLPPMPIVFTLRVGARFAPAADAHAQQRRLEQYFAAELRSATQPAAELGGQAAESRSA